MYASPVIESLAVVQVSAPLTRYSTRYFAAPVTASHVSGMLVFPTVPAATFVGAGGAHKAVAAVTTVEAAPHSATSETPSPKALTWTSYDVPQVRSSTVYAAAVIASLALDQVSVSLTRYSRRYLAAPVTASHVSGMLVFPTVPAARLSGAGGGQMAVVADTAVAGVPHAAVCTT